MKEAICATDENSRKWLSFNLQDIQYAKQKCEFCNVKKQCLMSSLDKETAGVRAGYSEFDRLMMQWKPAEDLDDDNWS